MGTVPKFVLLMATTRLCKLYNGIMKGNNTIEVYTYMYNARPAIRKHHINNSVTVTRHGTINNVIAPAKFIKKFEYRTNPVFTAFEKQLIQQNTAMKLKRT